MRVTALLGMAGREIEGFQVGARRPPQSVVPGRLASEAAAIHAQGAD